MARKLPEKIEDWTPPWETRGVEFDADEAKELIFNLMTAEQKLKGEKSALTVAVTEAKSELATVQAQMADKPKDEAAKDQEISALRTKVTKLEADGRPDDRKLIDRYEVALEHGLSKRDARRLVGDTVEELEEDAAEFAERLGIGKESGEGGDGKPPAPPSRRPTPSSKLGNGRDRSNEAPALVTAEDILAGKGPSLADPNALTLAPLAR